MLTKTAFKYVFTKKYEIFWVGVSELESLTSRLSNGHSTIELHAQQYGWSRRNRTFDDGSKDRCLAAWRYSSAIYFIVKTGEVVQWLEF